MADVLGTNYNFYWKGGTADTDNLNTKHPGAVKGDRYFVSTDNDWNNKDNWLVLDSGGFGGFTACGAYSNMLFYDAHRYPVAGDIVILAGFEGAAVAAGSTYGAVVTESDINCTTFPQSELLYGGATGAWSGITHSYGSCHDSVGPNGETGADIDAINGGKLSRLVVFPSYTTILQKMNDAGFSNYGARIGEKISQGNPGSQFNMGYPVQGLSILADWFECKGLYTDPAHGEVAQYENALLLTAPLDITKWDLTSNMKVSIDGERYNGENSSYGGYACGQTFGQIFIDREGNEHNAQSDFRDVYITDLYQDISYRSSNNILTTEHVVPTVNFGPAYRGTWGTYDSWAADIACQVENLNIYPNVNNSNPGGNPRSLMSVRVSSCQTSSSMGMSLGTVTQHQRNPWHDINDVYPSDNLLRNTVTYNYAGSHQVDEGGTIDNLILQSGWARPLVGGASDIPWTILNGEMGAWLPSKLSSYDREQPYWAGFRIAGKSGDSELSGNGMLVNGTNAIFDFLIGTYISSNVASESVRDDAWRTSFNTGK